jgi:hypothetical protein
MSSLDKYDTDSCERQIMLYALDLINRQKAEIEEKSNKLREVLPIVAELKAEAITEFEERLNDTKFKQGNDYIIYADNVSTVAKELKEGVGE